MHALKSAALWSFVVFGMIMLGGCAKPQTQRPSDQASLIFPGEKHFKNVRQLTEGGTNAEAYWSFDGKWLSFQRKGPAMPGVSAVEDECDQIYAMKADGSEFRKISSGKGRTTCGFYYPDNSRILYSSTHAYGDKCPPNPDHSKGYVWPIYDTYQIFSVKTDGSDLMQVEPGAPRAYNAEATVCKDGSVIFTSDRDGDLDLYLGKLDSFGTIKDVKRITKILGYDGGAVFSEDCKKIAWRASRPKPGKVADEYKSLLKQHLVRPSALEIWVANVDGTHAHQVTRINVASFAPGFTPDGNRLLFSANPRDPGGRHFDMYMINLDGTGFERVTFSNTFESFPMFSPDGKYLAFSSNRNGKTPRETNVFIAEWQETPAREFTFDDADAANRFMSVVKTLSAPEMEGRGVGTVGLKMAEKYVAERFTDLGLRPFFDTFKTDDKTAAANQQGFMQLVQFKADKGLPERTASNVLATWGNACGKVAPVVIGAHLDHLGHGAENSLEPTKKGIHFGADDNASGVAGVLEAARIIREQVDLAKDSCFIFAAFTGEETGIVGSSRFAEILDRLPQKPKAMLNLDMVGRMENNVLTVFGTASAKEWKKLIETECGAHDLTCPGGGDGYGPSDHMAFYIKKVPVLHFFTGPHVDYHRTSDVASKINATGGVQTAEVIAAVAIKVASPKFKLSYVKAKAAPESGMFGRVRASKGAYLGTIPDYSTLSSPHGPSGGGAAGGGIRIAGTRPESPADKAGVKEGDILMAIDKKPIGTLQDFMNILSELEPGQKIVLTIKRGEAVLKLPATVGKRQ